MVIERAYLRYRAREEIKKETAKIRDNKYVESLEKYLQTRPDISSFEAAATKIQHFLGKVKTQRELKALRLKLKGMPFVCRGSFVKVYYLKKSTGVLMSDVCSKL